ncbi:unnamed protein product [Penicillium pancosmium]
MADTENHARLRKAMSPAFSPRALASQEPILQHNVELYLNKLQDHATNGLQLDLRLWYNYVTLDMIGDLAFGESFGCLDSSGFHAWAQFVTVVNFSHWSADFLPERWLEEDPQFATDVKEAFQPFSVGPQSCVGKKFAYDSMNIILARTLWRFDMKLESACKEKYSQPQVPYVSIH